jgi:hypothetical protein
VRLSIPPRSATFVLIDKGDVTTGVTDIDPANKLVQVFPNPATTGNFTVRLKGISPAERVTLRLINQAGQVLYEKASRGADSVVLNRFLKSGNYSLQVIAPKGITTKKIIVP